MKKLKLLIVLFMFFLNLNILFSQNKMKFKITEKKEINTSSIKMNFHFSGKRFDSLFYKRISDFYLNIKVNDSLYERKKINYSSGSFIIDGVEPGSNLNIKASFRLNDTSFLINDTLIKSDEIKFIKLKNQKKLSFEKKESLEDSFYFITNGASVDDKGNFIGAYCTDGIMPKPIKEDGTGDWYYKNGIIGFCYGVPLFFSGFDKYQNKLSYYNSGLYIRDNIVVFKRENKISKVDWFIQNGPILIKDKKNNCNKKSNKKESRSAIGFNSSHYMFYIFSLKPMTLFDFSEELLKRKIDGALLLDGAWYRDKYGTYGKKKSNIMNIIFYK